MTTRVLEYASPAEASEALARQVADDLAVALEAGEGASLVVSGGSSPLRLFDALSRQTLDWNRVSVIPSDERVVPVDHKDSNAGMIRQSLLNHAASAASLVSLLPDALGSLAAVEERLGRVPLPLTHVILGMGADGHTASLFPNSPDLAAALESQARVIGLTVPGLSSDRVSLTPMALTEARAISLLLFGQEKRRVLESALEAGPTEQLPVRVILNNPDVPVTVYWAPEDQA